MTAAILQFQPISTHTSNHTHSQSALNTQSNTQSDYIETTLTKEYHQILIDMLDKEHPFRAVRLATDFNQANGFELIPYAHIRKWKKQMRKIENWNPKKTVFEKLKLCRMVFEIMKFWKLKSYKSNLKNKL